PDQGRLLHVPLPEYGVHQAQHHPGALLRSAGEGCAARRPLHHHDDLQPALPRPGAHRSIRRARVVAAALGGSAEGDRGRSGRQLMYGALWRVLPGPVWVRILILLVLVALVLYCLVTWVFPWVDSILQSNEEGTVAV